MTRFLIHLIKTHTKQLAQKIFKQAKTLMKLYPYNAHATKDGEYITAQFWSSETCIRKLLKTGYDLTIQWGAQCYACLLYTSPSPRDRQKSRMPSSA